MVFIEDSGSVFDAQLDMVWKLGEAHIKEGNRIHPNTRNNNTEILNETTFINSWKQVDDAKGQNIRMKIRGTMYYPLGIAFEILEGPFVDSKYFVYYIPIDNNKTGVTVVGDFKSNIIPEDKIKPIVLDFSERVFNEDVAYLKTMIQDKDH
ncbi:MAG: hypothetical protein M3264_05285 [Thermoproteota archaeon]|jgi:hypothetical protein|nr:hypothetical protein [Thermoproteota archaeon]